MARHARPSRGQTRAPSTAAVGREAEARHAIHIRPNSRRAVPDRAEGTSAREPGAVSRRSGLSTRARGSVDSQIPLRDYFLWVGGVLLVLLFAADSLIPRPCQASSPNRILRDRRSGLFPIGGDRKQLSSIPASPHSGLCSQTRRLPLPPRRRSALISPMLHDSRRHQCPSEQMRVTGTPQSRPVSVKRLRG